MNRLITTLLASALALAALTMSIATQHGGNMADHFAAMAKHLGLSPTQEKQLKEQHLIAKKKLDAIGADKKLDAKARSQAKAQLHQDMMSKAKMVLSQEQFKKLQGLHQTRQVEMHLHDMLQKLDLTEEQSIKIKALVHTTTTSMQAIRADSSLSDAQKEEKSKELHSETLHEIHAMLTPAQQKKLEKMVHGG